MKILHSEPMMRKEKNRMKEKEYGRVVQWEKNISALMVDFLQNCRDITIQVIMKMKKNWLSQTNLVYTKVWFTQEN